MEKETLLAKAKMFEEGINTLSRQIIETEKLIHEKCVENIFELVNNLESKQIDLEHTNECTYINDELSYIDKVYIEENELYVEYRLYDEVEEGLTTETYNTLIVDVEPRGVRDIFYTIIQDIKRKN